MESNLTKAGWLLLIVSLILLAGGWYFAKFIIGWQFNTVGFIVGGGVALIGGGAALLAKLDIEIMK